MDHITEKQIIVCAEHLNMSSKPTLVQMQILAKELGTTYGVVSTIWDQHKIGKKLTNRRAVDEREEQKRRDLALKQKHKCEICGSTDLGKRAKICHVCAEQKRRENPVFAVECNKTERG